MKPVPVPVPVPQERRSHQTTPSSSSGSNALRAPVEKREGKLRDDQKTLIKQVSFAWAEHQGWEPGMWVRRDMILITEFVQKLGGTIQLYKTAIARAPKGASFACLTTGPRPGEVGLLEELLLKTRDGEWAEQKKRLASGMVSIGDVMRRAMEQPVGA